MPHAKRHGRADVRLRWHAAEQPDSPVPGASRGDTGHPNGERIVVPPEPADRGLRCARTLTIPPGVSRDGHTPLRCPRFRTRQSEPKALGSSEDADSLFRAQPSLRTDSITIGVTGTSLCPALVPVVTPAMDSTTSEPTITLPNTQ